MNATIQMAQSPSPSASPIASTALSVGSANTSWILSSNHLWSPIAKRVYMVVLSIVLTAYGIVLFALVTSHFDYANTYCNQFVTYKTALAQHIAKSSNHTPVYEAALNDHPELYFWDWCFYKVYPFDSICDCRNFRASFYPHSYDEKYLFQVDEMKTYFNLSLDEMPVHILSKWRMLEKFQWKEVNDIYDNRFQMRPKPVNLSKQMFIAKKMRLFEFDHVLMGHLDDAISNWRELEYFYATRSYLEQLPSTFGTLYNLKFFKWGEMLYPKQFPIELCSIKGLQAIHMYSNGITSIPHCVSQLTGLKELVFGYAAYLEELPLALLRLPKLDTIAIQSSRISLETLMEYNNLTDEQQLDEFFDLDQFDYGEHSYYFSESTLCTQYHQNMTSFPPKLQQFMNATGCCAVHCDVSSHSFLASRNCYSFQWQNGVCEDRKNIGCNSVSCGWDGGDCHQLCECMIEDANNVYLLGNGECDALCNTRYCNYDEGDCVNKTTTNYETCDESYGSQHLCNTSWINDGFCDSNCNIWECGYDGSDCNGCHDQCREVELIFGFAAGTDDFITKDEICDVWSFIESQQTAFGQQIYANCSHFMTMDRNGDSRINLREILIGVRDFGGLSLGKALQIDCSQCLTIPQNYDK